MVGVVWLTAQAVAVQERVLRRDIRGVGQQICATSAQTRRLADVAQSAVDGLEFLLAHLVHQSAGADATQRQNINIQRAYLVVEILEPPFRYQVALDLPSRVSCV